jgi:MFS family permease
VTTSATRIKSAQPALLMVFILVGHTALCSVAWVPEYIDRLGVSFALWGTILGVGAIGSMASLLVASRIILRFGSRLVLRFGLYLGLIFLVSLGLTTNPVVWAGLNAGFTLCMSFVGISANTHAVALQKMVPRTIVPRLHAGWSMGAVLAAITGAVSTSLISLQVFLIATALITAVLFELLRPRLLGPSEDGHLEDKAAHIKRRFYQAPAQLWILSAGLFCAVYPEIAIVDWATVFARDILDAPLALRSAPFGGFMLGMIVGRLLMTRLADRFHPHTLASRGALLAAITLGISALLPSFEASWPDALSLLVAVVLWLVTGFGMSGIAPTFFAASAHIKGVSTTWALSRMQLVTQFIMIGAKVMMGAVAEGINLQAAFALPMILLIAGGIIAALTTRLAQADELGPVEPTTGAITLPIMTETGHDD